MVHIGHIISYKTIRTLSIYLFIGLEVYRLSPHHVRYVRFAPLALIYSLCPSTYLMPLMYHMFHMSVLSVLYATY